VKNIEATKAVVTALRHVVNVGKTDADRLLDTLDLAKIFLRTGGCKKKGGSKRETLLECFENAACQICLL